MPLCHQNEVWPPVAELDNQEVAEHCPQSYLVSVSRASESLDCKNKQFLKRIIVYIYTNQRKYALRKKTLFMEKMMNKPRFLGRNLKMN